MPVFDPADIRRYYDRHTPAFVTFGQGGHVGALHRAVWGPGVTDRPRAFRYVDDQIFDLARRLASTGGTPHVVDLGCGVGGSLGYLAERLPIRGTGITLSPVQVQLANRRFKAAGVSDRVTCLEGDYCDLPAGVMPADLAYAIESFVHGPSPERFFAECHRLVRPHGLLVVCDDFRRSSTDAAAARAIERFCRGWQVNTLIEPVACRALALASGFEHVSTADLSPYLELGRLRDRAIDTLATVASWLPATPQRFGPLLGGSALQTCLRRGWIGYDLVVFRRVG